MRIELQAFSHMHVSRLLPAFPLVIAAAQGKTLVRRRGFERVVVPGQPLVVAPFETVDLYLDGGAMQPACCSLQMRLRPGGAPGASLHHRLSRRVFMQPQHTWSAAFIAGLLRASPTQVRRTLFSEGAALTELCRTQRLMRALFEVLHDNPGAEELKRRIGWSPRSDLEAAFYDWFGLSLHALARSGARRPAADATRAAAFVPRWLEQQMA
ncbi:AraC family transcriptional regulator [Cupriavidus sp. P-10]|uniref:AraC family transcriptional regulator n=1 Tax=Cupriavidus sp. P-10 TaxID=2027911 RepID=UPI000EE1961F|nr:AraC family transcriptional regulator [Cupriavidus sp. P-10]BDB27417.1 AraC family transcriptional regulator [Cupriavidus sp. P-10]